MAARGPRAAAGDAGGWLSEHQGTRAGCTPLGRVSPGPERYRLCRARERGDRIPLGRESNGSTAGAGGRIGSPHSRRDRRDQHLVLETVGVKDSSSGIEQLIASSVVLHPGDAREFFIPQGFGGEVTLRLRGYYKPLRLDRFVQAPSAMRVLSCRAFDTLVASEN